MNNTLTYLFTKMAHIFFRSHRVRKVLKKFASQVHHKTILEIGSGGTPAEAFFDSSNTFIKSDLNPKTTDSLQIDVAQMKIKNKYDLILCINVLDDVYDYQKAVDNIYNALKKKGVIFLVVNGFYPIHDIPNDYWRFTEYSLRIMFKKFSHLQIRTIGPRRFPGYYILRAQK